MAKKNEVVNPALDMAMDALESIVSAPAPEVPGVVEQEAKVITEPKKEGIIKRKAKKEEVKEEDETFFEEGKVFNTVDLDTLSGESHDDEESEEEDSDELEAEDSEEGEEEDTEEADDFEERIEKASKQSNISELRRILNRVNQENKELKTTGREKIKQEVEVELKKEIDTLKERLAKTEQYEEIFGLYSQPAFHQKYVEGSQVILGRLVKLFKDYDVDPNEAMTEIGKRSNSRKELNAYLGDILDDYDAREEVKRELASYGQLQLEAQEMMKKPGEAVQRIAQKMKDDEIARMEANKVKIKQSLTNGWQFALERNKTGEKALPELTENPANPEHNKNTVLPLLKDAKALYEKVISSIVNVGGIPDNATSSIIATLAQLATATHTIAAGRDHYYKEWKKLRGEKSKQDSYDRPSVNGRVKSENRSSKDSSEDIASRLFREAQSELRR